jgi:uncharacterized protein YbjT (DUF2867 family)
MRIVLAGATGLVGRRVEALLDAAGHEVVGLSRAHGWDLSSPVDQESLTELLIGAEALIDVTNVITQDRDEAITFFEAVARHLAQAAASARVQRAVLLSIIGVDGIPHDAHYVGKYRQELAYRQHFPDVRVVRAAQFHEFPGMALAWGRDGDRAVVPDFPVQPVDVEAVVRVLIEAAAVAPAWMTLELAGPRQERLPDLASRLVRARGEHIQVVRGPASPELAAGACLPSGDALIAGPSFDEWLSALVNETV